MTTTQSKDELIAAVESTVNETLAYFEGPGQSNRARIDQWGAWDVLAHFEYWHYATAWGIESAGMGGPPWQLSGTADQINDACLALHQGESFDELIARLRRATGRLVRAAQGAQDLDAAAFRAPDGRTVSIQQRLETIARHWRGHLQALQQAAG